MQTEITRLLGIKYPIIQGGMAWVAEHHLAAAVSEAGGLGLIGAASAPAEWVREQIRAARKLTDKPFGVNIMLLSPFVDDIVDLVIEEGVKVVTTGAGNPGKYMERFHEAGITVIPVVPSAEAVQVGTRFAVAKESNAHQNFKDKILKAKDIDTVISASVVGHPVRAVKNKLTTSYAHAEKDFLAGRKTKEDIEVLGAGALRNAVVDGDVVTGSVMAGQIAGLIRKEETCEEILKDLYYGAQEVILEEAKRWADIEKD